MEIIGLHSANRHVIGCGTIFCKLLTSFPILPMLCAVDSVSLGPSWRARKANCLQKMLEWSQLSRPGSRHLALISSMLGCTRIYHDGAYLHVKMTLWTCEFLLWLVLYSTIRHILRTYICFWLIIWYGFDYFKDTKGRNLLKYLGYTYIILILYCIIYWYFSYTKLGNNVCYLISLYIKICHKIVLWTDWCKSFPNSFFLKFLYEINYYLNSLRKRVRKCCKTGNRMNEDALLFMYDNNSTGCFEIISIVWNT